MISASLPARNGRILALILQIAAPAIRHTHHHLAAFGRFSYYAVLGFTSILFEEANPIFGGIAARHDRANIALVVLSVTIGTWLASFALYYIGFREIDWVRRKWPKKERLLDSALAIVRRHPWRASLSIRFAYGLRLPVPIACGAAQVPLRLYATASFISCLVWSVAFSYLGLAFGGAALRVLHFLDRYEIKLGVIAIILVGVLIYLQKRKRADSE